MSKDLADRVKLLIDTYWEGNVNRAAKALGIPQPTLQRIGSGKTPNPRVKLLQQIASGCNVSTDWLLTGKGEGPPSQDEKGRYPSGSLLRWDRVVDSLGLSYEARWYLFGAALGADGLGTILVYRSSGATDEAIVDAAWTSSELCMEAWADLVEVAVAQLGAEVVRRELEANAITSAAGFTEFALFLGEKKGMTKADRTKYLKKYQKDSDDAGEEMERMIRAPTRATGGTKSRSSRDGVPPKRRAK